MKIKIIKRYDFCGLEFRKYFILFHFFFIYSIQCYDIILNVTIFLNEKILVPIKALTKHKIAHKITFNLSYNIASKKTYFTT